MGVRYRGIIFDLSGVLLWDGDWHLHAWQVMAKQLRGRGITAEEMEQCLQGRPTAEALPYLVGRSLERNELLHLCLEKEALYRERCLLNSQRFMLSPGATDLLEYLAAHRIPRAIATSSDLTNVQFFLRYLNLGRWFDARDILFDDGIRRGKPAGDVYVEAAGAIGVDPHWCVAVEDSVAGLAAAQEAGIGYVVALGPAEAHERLAGLPGVSLVIRSLRELPRELLITRS